LISPSINWSNALSICSPKLISKSLSSNTILAILLPYLPSKNKSITSLSLILLSPRRNKSTAWSIWALSWPGFKIIFCLILSAVRFLISLIANSSIVSIAATRASSLESTARCFIIANWPGVTKGVPFSFFWDNKSTIASPIGASAPPGPEEACFIINFWTTVLLFSGISLIVGARSFNDTLWGAFAAFHDNISK